jgi:5-methylcytosine-specific restriction protein A
MSPTIRIDDEVYSWLQKKARPFEDTPNTVLRKIAGLDKNSELIVNRNNSSKGDHKMAVSSRMNKGQILNQQWKVDARHALYHRDGHWFNNLKYFPGALFDPEGYILFKTEDEYYKSPYLRIGKETNVPNGISSIPGYIRKK